MATIDFVVKNGLTVTEKTTILGTADASTATDTNASLYTAGGVAISKKLYVGTDLQAAGTTINLGTSASTLTTATVGGAITGNILKMAGTGVGTVNLTTDVTSGIVNQWQSVTGTINIGASGNINLGTSASVLTTATVGGAITGNTLKIAGTSVGTTNISSDVTTGTANFLTGITTGTLNIATGGGSTTNLGGAAAVLNIGTSSGDSIIELRGNATTGTATIRTNTGVVTANVFNTIATTGNLFGAGTTIAIGANSGTVTIGNPTVVGTQTTVNLWNTTSTTVNAFGSGTSVNIGHVGSVVASIATVSRLTNVATITTSAAHGLSAGQQVAISSSNGSFTVTTVTLSAGTTGSTIVYPNSGTDLGSTAATGSVTLLATGTLTVGQLVGGNTFKIQSIAAGTINLTSDVTTGIINLYTGTTTGTVNLATGGASTTNIGGAAAAVNIGTTGGNSTLTIRGNATTGTATLATNAATAAVFNANATTVNAFGAGTAIAIGATTGTVTIANPALTMSNSATTFNMNGTNPIIASSGIGTANVFNSNISLINLGQAADITIGGTVIGAITPVTTYTTLTGTSVVAAATYTGVTQSATSGSGTGAQFTVTKTGAGTAYSGVTTITVTTVGSNYAVGNTVTLPGNLLGGATPANDLTFTLATAVSTGTTTVRGRLQVNGNTTLGDASGDTVTYIANSASVPNTYTFTLDDVTNASISYPIRFGHTTSSTAAVGIGTGVQFVTENAAGTAISGAYIESVATNVTAASEAFNLVFKTMSAGTTPAQALLINSNTHTVGVASTAQTINTQISSNLTVTTGATGATSVGNTLLVAAGAGGITSGAGGAATFRGGEATTSGAGGIATFRSGDAAGTNITGANTIILAGNGTGTGGSGSIVFRTASAGSTGAAANTMVDRFTIASNGSTTFSSDVTVGGNLTVNGTLTTLNSSTITVDDKNIELASVAIITGLTVTITSGSGVITFIGASTSTGLLVGQTLSITSTQTGAPVMGVAAVIQSVDSLTQVTMSVVATGTTGNATVSSNGATDTTADGGGITILGTTNKTWNYVHANTSWTSNQNVDIFNTKTYKINATDVLSSAAVLQNAATASIGSLSAAATVSIGAATQNNILNINGNTTAGTATLTTNVTSGIVNEFVGVTGTINYGSAATTINMFNTATAAQTFQLGGASTGASTYSIAHGATAAATTKIVNLGTAGVSTSVTNVNIGSSVSGATGTTAINSGTINLGTVQSAATTLNIGPAITGNTIKYASTAAGTVNLTTDVTTGIVNLFTSVTTSGTVNLATAGAAAVNIGGNAATVNVGGSSGDAVVEIRGNGTGGTATLRTNVTSGIVNEWQSVTGTINFGVSGAINLGTGAAAITTVKVGGTISGNTLKIAGTTGGTINLTTDVTTGAISVFPSLTTATMTIGSAAAGRLAIAFNQASTSTTTGAVTIAGGLGVNGAVNALTKSFIIPHPTKKGKLLKHGSLEGPEFGVYTRGRTTGKIIELPDYWTGLVDEDTITVDLTPIGKHQKLYVEKIEGNRVYINNEGLFSGSISCFYTVWGERKDVGKLDIEADE
jgi:fibronectin-binding autotransporter adhesin